MLQVKTTTSKLGINIAGPAEDFSETLQALHQVIGPTGKRPCMAAAHIRVLKFCQDMENACQKQTCSFSTLWPEAVFIAGALSGFIKFESEDLSKKTFLYDVISSPQVIFAEHIIIVRLLQSKILAELAQVIAKASFARILNTYGSGHTYFVDYTTQFLDLVNYQYINLSKEKRLTKLAAFTLHILTRAGKYPEIEREVLQQAKQQACPPAAIILEKNNYPDKLVW